MELDKFPRNICLSAVNEFGKTERVAELIRFFLDSIPGCNVGFTSHVSRQCEMLEGYLKRHQALPRYAGWKLVEGRLEAPNGNWARWFTAKDVGAVESLHAPTFMICIIDEVKSMSDDIIDATDRWNARLRIFVSSKGLMTGRFYDAHTTQRHLWNVHEATAYDCPWISRKQIEDKFAKHGKTSALVKSMIFNQFSDVDVRNLINLEQINRCFANPQPFIHPGFNVAGIDLSAAKKAGDDCYCVARTGNKLKEPYLVPPCEGEMEVVGLVIRWLKRENINFAYIDGGGLGGPMADRICEVLADDKNIKIIRVDFGGKPFVEHGNADDRGTEIWCNLAGQLELRELIFEWVDATKNKFIAQATGRVIETLSNGRVKLESKKKMRARGMKSPDLVDATALCLIRPDMENQRKADPLGLGREGFAAFKDGGSGGSENKQRVNMSSGGYRLGR